MRNRWLWAISLAVGVCIAGAPRQEAQGRNVREGGIFRISFLFFDYIDPALAYSGESWALLDTTCARLMTLPDKPTPEGFRLVPEVAADFPRISRNGKTYTFRLRSGFRFSDGTPVRASAFARAINRTLATGIESPALQYTGDIAGAADVQAGKTRALQRVSSHAGTRSSSGSRGRIGDFAAETAMPFFCAVPPTLPSTPRASAPSRPPARTVTEYRPGERVTIRRNRFYRGTRPHHVDGFDVDLRALGAAGMLRPGRARRCGLGHALAAHLLRAGRRLVAKYGVNRSQFFVRPGLTSSGSRLQHARPLFRDNVQPATSGELRHQPARARANRDRSSLGSPHRPVSASEPAGFQRRRHLSTRTSEPRTGESARARQPPRRKAVLYSNSGPEPLAVAQESSSSSREIGLDVEVRGIPIHSAPRVLQQALRRRASPGTWCFSSGPRTSWIRYAYLNVLFDRRFTAAATSGGSTRRRSTGTCAKARAPAGSRPLPGVRRPRRPARPRRRAVRADQLPHRADARVEARRLRRAATRARPDGGLSQVASALLGRLNRHPDEAFADGDPVRALPISIVSTTSLVAGSMRETVRPPCSRPRPPRIRPRRPRRPSSDRRSCASRPSGIDPRDGVVAGIRDPDGSLAVGNAGRPPRRR